MKKDTIVPSVIILLLILLLEPFGFMPSMAIMTTLVAATTLLVLFAVFAWREKGVDEREEANIHRADRFGYLSGMAVLAIGVVVSYFTMNEISRVLVIALIIMVCTKALALSYTHRHN